MLGKKKMEGAADAGPLCLQKKWKIVVKVLAEKLVDLQPSREVQAARPASARTLASGAGGGSILRGTQLAADHPARCCEFKCEAEISEFSLR